MEYVSTINVSELRKEKTIEKQLKKFEEKLKEVKFLPGYYKWWAKKRILKQIFKNLKLTFAEKKKIIRYLEKKEKGLYCIYVGIAKKSIRDRLKWHIFDTHTKRRVKSGLLSTLRKTISSLFAKDMADKDRTNKVIDKLCVEYHAFDEPKELAISKIKQFEKELLQNNSFDFSNKLYILNIDSNKHPFNQNTKLKNIRKFSKLNALNKKK